MWQHFERDGVAEDRSEDELAVLRQIAVDVPRTAPGAPPRRGLGACLGLAWPVQGTASSVGAFFI